MKNVPPVLVDNSRIKLENYIDEKYDQVVIKYLKEKKQIMSNNNPLQVIKRIK